MTHRLSKQPIGHGANGPIWGGELSAETAQGLRQLRNSDRIRPWFRDTRVVSGTQQDAWFADYEQKSDDVVWVATTADGIVVAAAALYDIDRATGKAELGRVMADSALAGMPKTGLALIAHIIAQCPSLGIGQIYLFVKDDNERAIRTYDSLGFRQSTTRSEDGMLFMTYELV